MPRCLDDALVFHRSVADGVIAAVAAVPDALWEEPYAAGKWSPAQILEHLSATYEVVLQELAGGPGMQIRTRPLQRLLLRLLLVPRLLRGRRFPAGARAPRELRPAGQGLDRAAALAVFRQRASALEQAARLAGPDQRITHAYFGAAPVADGVLLVARHLDHHRAQLVGSADRHAKRRAQLPPTSRS